MRQDDDFLQDDLDDEKTIEFIKNYLPQDLKNKFTDDEFYYFLDLTSTTRKAVSSTHSPTQRAA